MTVPVLELSRVTKDFHGLRPLRLQALTLAAGEHVAILGFDRTMAEVFVNLVTGVTLPDEGEIRVFGRATSAIADSADWLATVDRFGIVSERAVLIDQFTVIQNLAMPFTLDVEPPPDDIRRQAEHIAAEVGLADTSWQMPAAGLDGPARTRVRLGRALALNPAILLLEHVNAGAAADDAVELGADIRSIADRRGAAIVAVTADSAFARAVASRVVTLEPATGHLKAQAGRRWFGRRV